MLEILSTLIITQRIKLVISIELFRQLIQPTSLVHEHEWTVVVDEAAIKELICSIKILLNKPPESTATTLVKQEFTVDNGECRR